MKISDNKKIYYYPVTPAGTLLTDLGATTEEQAWENLLSQAAHMPYKGIDGFKLRGYTIEHYEEDFR